MQPGDARQGRAWRVRGRVQGVGFRAATCERAGSLGLEGVARNEADGSVFVAAFGAAAALAALEAFLRHGPEPARVDSVVAEACPPAPTGRGFHAR